MTVVRRLGSASSELNYSSTHLVQNRRSALYNKKKRKVRVLYTITISQTIDQDKTTPLVRFNVCKVNFIVVLSLRATLHLYSSSPALGLCDKDVGIRMLY